MYGSLICLKASKSFFGKKSLLWLTCCEVRYLPFDNFNVDIGRTVSLLILLGTVDFKEESFNEVNLFIPYIHCS